MKGKFAQRQFGFAVLDMLMKLGFVLALLVIIMMVAKLIQSRVTAISSTTSLTTMVEGVRNVFGRSGNFKDLTAQAVIAANIVDKSMVQGTEIINEWNQKVEVRPYSFNGPDDGFEIVYPGVPKEDCAQFVANAEAPFAMIIAGTQTAKDMTASPAQPFDGVKAATGCGGDVNEIRFRGARR